MYKFINIFLIFVIFSACSTKSTNPFEVARTNENIDLYNLFYIKEINDMLNGSNNNNFCGNFLSHLIKQPEWFISNNQKFDNLSSIYYFSSILNLRNIEYESVEFKKEIVKYINEIQLKSGPFAFSLSHKNQVESSSDAKQSNELYLSTFMALVSLNNLDASLDNYGIDSRENVTRWVTYYLNNKQFWEKASLENSGHILLLIRISRILELSLVEYSYQINKYITEITEISKEKSNRGIEDFDMFNFYNVFELNLIFNNKILHIKPIDEYIRSLQSDNGGFKLNISSDGNIVATFIAINYLKRNNLSIPNIEKLSSTLKKNLEQLGCN